MIRFWNRFEVYVGFSLKKFNEIRDILEANDIKYSYSVTNRYSHPNRNEGHSNYSKMYYIYVNKKDKDIALNVVRKFL